MSRMPTTAIALTFGDGRTWRIEACSAAGDAVVAGLAAIMRTSLLPPSPAAPGDRCVRIEADGEVRRLVGGTLFGANEGLEGRPRVRLPVDRQLTDLRLHAMQLQVAHSLTEWMEHDGALLLHAALIERDGTGVALAAPGGAGKTTAARRTSLPWKAVCDDAVLVLQREAGDFCAHPWPTWSRLTEGAQESWLVAAATRLGAVAFLQRGDSLGLQPVGAGHAAVKLDCSAEQLAGACWPELPEAAQRAARARRFDAACRLAAEVPCYVLTSGLEDDYWTSLDDALRRSLR